MAASTWNLVDVSLLDPSHGALPTKERRQLYESITKRFRIHKDGHISGDMIDPKFAAKVSDMKSDWHEIYAMIFFHIFVFSYFVPVVIFIILVWYFTSRGMWLWLLSTCLIGAIIEFYPPTLWRDFMNTTWNYMQYNYFSCSVSNLFFCFPSILWFGLVPCYLS